CSTRTRSASPTCRVLPFNTREAVASDTPARSATSYSVVCAMGLLRRGAPNVPQRPGKRLPARPDCQVPAVLATAGSGDPRHHGITAPLPDGITAPLPDSITAPLPDSITAPLPDDGPTGAPMWPSSSMPGAPDSPRATG